MEDYRYKNYTESDYAIINLAKGLLPFANEIVEITLERYLSENPEKTENDFLILRNYLMEINLEQVRHENKTDKENNSLSLLEDTDDVHYRFT